MVGHNIHQQINDDPIGAGFIVEYTAIRKGRSYDKIVFQMVKTDNRATTEKLMKHKAKIKRKIKAGDKLAIPAWAEERGRQIAQEKGGGFARLEREFKEFSNDPKDAGAVFVGFCKQKESLR